MNIFRRSTPPPPIPESMPEPSEGPLAEFVTLTIPGEHFGRWTLKPSAPLEALIDQLSAHLAALDTGEIRLAESIEGAALIYLDGPNAEQLFSDILPLLQQNPLCAGARIVIDVDVNDKQDFKPKREVTLA